MIKFRDLVLLMHALQWLERTSGIFNYAALGAVCQNQRVFTLSLRNKPAVHVLMSHSILKLSSVTNLLNKDLM